MAETVDHKFQSTLPVRGATASPSDFPEKEPQFQSTLPVRGATWDLFSQFMDKAISIHAPRTGSDSRQQTDPDY